jgi:hypothetical protein
MNPRLLQIGSTTCLTLTWQEGAGYPLSSFILTAGNPEAEACGYEDQIAPVGPPRH